MVVPSQDETAVAADIVILSIQRRPSETRVEAIDPVSNSNIFGHQKALFADESQSPELRNGKIISCGWKGGTK